jgi:cardiolipin synthase
MCVTDDIAAVCGTINLDYRSLYHHFEDGCLMIGCDSVAAIRKDFEQTFPVCREVTEQYRSGRSAMLRFGQLVLRLFAPLM